MRDQFQTQLQELLEKILLMGGTAESMITLAMDSLLKRDASLSQRVLEREEQIDALEIDVDDRVVGLIVHQQPVARDARFATAALRVAADLERIGDQAVNVCKNAEYVLKDPSTEPPAELRSTAELASKMLSDGLAALSTWDCELAEHVLQDEKRANQLRDETFRVLLRRIIVDPLTAQQSLSLVLISRNLERICDHATNIAQEVVYLARGQDVRHQHDRSDAPDSAAAAG